MKIVGELPDWDLSALYSSFDLEFHDDVSRCKEFVNRLKEWCKNKREIPKKQKIAQYVKQEEEFRQLHERVHRYATLVYLANNDNQEARHALAETTAVLGLWNSSRVPFLRWLSELTDDELKCICDEHIERLLALAKHTGTVREERFAQAFRNTGSRVLNSLYEQTLSSTKGKGGLSLAQCRSLHSSPSMDRRILAFDDTVDICQQVGKTAEQCLNSIAGEWCTLADIARFSSPLEQALFLCKTDGKTLSGLLSAIDEMLPSFHSFFHLKTKLLGAKSPLPYHSLVAPLQGPLPDEFSLTEAKELINKYFSSCSSDIASVTQRAFANNWIDMKPRSNKCPGAFCHPLRAIGESRILVNYTGSFGDVLTLAHELGHAFHNSCLDGDNIWTQEYSIAIAETASVFCELLLLNGLIKDSSTEQRMTLLAQKISMAARLVVASYAHFHFEKAVYEQRQQKELSVEELNDLMSAALQAAYGNSVDTSGAQWTWVCRRHLFGTKRNFYNFPYAFGFVLASSLYSIYTKEPESFINKYKTFLRRSGKEGVAKAVSAIGIDVHQMNCWKDVITGLQQDLQEFTRRIE